MNDTLRTFNIIFEKINDVLQKNYGVENLHVYSLDCDTLLFETKYIKGNIICENNHFKLSLSYPANFDRWANSTVIFEEFESVDELVKFLENSPNIYYKLFICMSEEYKACLDDCPCTSLGRRTTPHGNLIDADALKAEIDNAFDKFANAIKDAPIIVPASPASSGQ